MDIVEQVARAIHDTEHNPAPDRCWNTDSTLDRAMFLDEAEAAIAAVRAADKEAGMVLVDASDVDEVCQRVDDIAREADDAGSYRVAQMIREPVRRLQAAVDALEDE